MAYPVRSLGFLALLVAPGFAAAQPLRGESQEPPLADETMVRPAGGAFDTDPAPVRQAQNVVPSVMPKSLPSGLADPDVVPAQYTGPGRTYGEIPTPVVTLNIEGSEITPAGQPVVYKLTVRNTSAARAHHVILKVVPPKNCTKVHTEPAPTHDEAEQRWEFKTIEPGQSRTVELSYKPKDDADEVKIQARVQIDYGRGMVTQVAPPTLSVKKEGPEKLVVGDTPIYRVTVKNTGRVTVRDIEVEDLLVKGLAHDDRETSRGTVDGRLTSSVDKTGNSRTWSIPALAPGQQRVFEYRVKAQETGKKPSTVRVKAPGMAPKQIEHDADVLTAALRLEVAGPMNSKGTVGQASQYRVVVRNQGTADLKNVVVRALFPPDMRPTRATNQGQAFKDSVQWTFKELKSGEEKELTLGLTTSAPGLRTIQFVAKGDKGQEQRQTVKTDFAGLPNIDWDTDVPGTVGAGKTMTYKVTVSNRGTAPAVVEISVDLPANVDHLRSDPASNDVTGKATRARRFPEFSIPAGKKTTYTMEVRAKAAGEARAVFWLIQDGNVKDAVRHDKVTNVSGTDERPGGSPPPAPDKTRVGAGPGRE